MNPSLSFVLEYQDYFWFSLIKTARTPFKIAIVKDLFSPHVSKTTLQ